LFLLLAVVVSGTFARMSPVPLPLPLLQIALGAQALAERDVVYFDTHVSPRTGKLEAANAWPGK
jgi:NhaP-type Na+/H+ or K+/H+ antiporter